MTYVPDTSRSDAVLGRLTFTPEALPDPSFSAVAHPLGPRSLRILFSNPVDDSALDASSFLLSASAPAVAPAVLSTSFGDSDRRSVVLSLSGPMTYGGSYLLSAPGVRSYYGESTVATFPLTASVPDPPKAVDAVLASNGFVDVVFDRPVGPTTSAAVGVLAGYDLPPSTPFSSGQSNLSSVTWTPSIPETNVRFSISGTPTLYGPPMVSFSGVEDSYGNVSSGLVPLTVVPAQPIPFNLSAVLPARTAAAYVDSLSDGPGGPGRALLNVFFSRPMLASDILDPSKWVLYRHGPHGDQSDLAVSTLPYPLLSDLVSFCAVFSEAFNAHVRNSSLHPAYTPAVDQAALIALAADLRTVYNSHASSSEFHLVPAPSDQVSAPVPSDLAAAIVVLNQLKSRFNSHRSSSGVHVLNDADYAVASPDATTAESAAVLADELRSKILSHELSAGYHVAPDPVNAPSAPYVLRTILPLSVATLKDAVRMVEEAGSKFRSHALDGGLHLYPDDAHASLVNPSVPQTLADCQAAALTLRNAHNSHVTALEEIPLLSIRNRASASSSLSPTESVTYFAQLEVSASSSLPPYSVRSNIRAEDLSSSTSFGDLFPVRAGSSPPSVLSVQIRPGSVTIRFDKGIEYPDATRLSLRRADGSGVPVQSFSLEASTRSLFLFVTDLMEAYRWHNQPPGGAVHKELDLVNFLLDSDFPSESLSSVISSLNRLRDVYDLHSASETYHQDPDPDPVTIPYATDLASAVALAQDLSDSFRAHNLSGSVHLSPGADYLSHSLYETVSVSSGAVADGEHFVLDMDIVGSFRDARNGDVAAPASVRIPFRGSSYLSYLAAAVPRSGLLYTSSGMRLLPDSLVSFFSGPMSLGPVGPSNLISDPPLSTSGSSWTSPTSLSTVVNGMTATAYSLEAVGLRDSGGNQVGPSIPPEWLTYAILQTQALGPFDLGPSSYGSLHYGDGRPAFYVAFEAYDELHAVLLEAFPSSIPVEVFLYTFSLIPVASAGPDSSAVALAANLPRGSYVAEVTVQDPGDTGTAICSLRNRFDPVLPIGSSVRTVIGSGSPSDHILGGYAVYVQFVADAATTYVHVDPEGASLSVWVMHEGRGGTVVQSGSGSSPFVLTIATSIGDTYVFEVASTTAGPHLVTVLPSDTP